MRVLACASHRNQDATRSFHPHCPSERSEESYYNCVNKVDKMLPSSAGQCKCGGYPELAEGVRLLNHLTHPKQCKTP
jgi:hypothetical protein